MNGVYEYGDYVFKDELSRYKYHDDLYNSIGPGVIPESYGGIPKSEYYKDTNDSIKSGYKYINQNYYEFSKNPLYYYKRSKTCFILSETEKAYLLGDKETVYWCPKSLMRNIQIVGNYINFRIWDKFIEKPVKITCDVEEII